MTQWAFGPGWVQWEGGEWATDSSERVRVVGRAARGGHVLEVEHSRHGLVAGQWVAVVQDGSAGIVNDRNAGHLAPGCYDRWGVCGGWRGVGQGGKSGEEVG